MKLSQLENLVARLRSEAKDTDPNVEFYEFHPIERKFIDFDIDLEQCTDVSDCVVLQQYRTQEVGDFCIPLKVITK